MWKPRIPINFLTLHYAWIVSMGLLALVVIYPYGNVSAVDAYFFGASASTESGLNTVDIKDIPTYQQLYIYFIPMITNLGFVNIIVVAVRLHWFTKKLKDNGSSSLTSRARDIESHRPNSDAGRDTVNGRTPYKTGPTESSLSQEATRQRLGERIPIEVLDESASTDRQHITFASDVSGPRPESKALYIPPPGERDKGHPIAERDAIESDGEDAVDIKPVASTSQYDPWSRRISQELGPRISAAKSIEKAASSFLAPGGISSHTEPSVSSGGPRPLKIPGLSSGVVVGRNSRLYNLTREDRDRLGGIEYRSLKLLLKVVLAYFFGLHLLGCICLVAWIHRAPSKYTDYLRECGQNKTWWAFYSAQTMVDNLGFTLTPDSMIHFKDATWPMLVMIFLAFAGNTLYPVFLRLSLWIAHKCVPRNSQTRETLRFILDHPRRCYTLLFPSTTTWVLGGIIFLLNAIDVILIIALDLNNPSVNDLPMGPRILSAIFLAASARHTGTTTLNIAEVNPGVQFSLLVMMYIAILPIAISIRTSNTYEEKTLGIYSSDARLDETRPHAYFLMHFRNQLAFDLWYIFLGTFCVCVAEAPRIMDGRDPAFAVFPVFFEIVSSYGNVGLSLGHPSVATSLSGQFNAFSKVVVCFMMIRGRHRALPYALDRAIMLPSDRLSEDGSLREDRGQLDLKKKTLPMKKFHTS